MGSERTTVTRVGSAEWEQAKREGRAVYIGRRCPRSKDGLARRGSVFANPFKIGMDPFAAMRILEAIGIRCVVEFTGKLDAAKSVECYRHLMRARLAGRDQTMWLAELADLRGCLLGCWCHESHETEPPCHGDVVAGIANGEEQEHGRK
jgi:hypothetical protein